MEFLKINFQFSLDCSLLNYSVCSNKANVLQIALSYSPPDMNKNITEIFGKLINIYRGENDILQAT